MDSKKNKNDFPSLGDWLPESDNLGFSPYVNLVYDRIMRYRDECLQRAKKHNLMQRLLNFLRGKNNLIDKSSLTIGIYGEWGSGKSTFLDLLRRHLEKRNRISTISLDAWQFNQEKELWGALLQNLLTRAPSSKNIFKRPLIKLRIWWYTVDWKSGSWELIVKIFFPLIRIFVFVFLISIALEVKQVMSFITNKFPNSQSLQLGLFAKLLLSFSGFLVLGTEKVFRAFHPQLNIELGRFSKNNLKKENKNYLMEFRDSFQWLINKVYNEKPLVILIDDLDRCLPEKAVQILEGIKLFLDVDRCVFIVGINKELISEAVLSQYHELFNIQKTDGDSGNDSDHFGLSIADFGSTYLDRIMQYSFTLPPLDEQTKRYYINSLLPEYYNNENVTEIFVKGLEGNPRKIKQALHTYLTWVDLNSKLFEDHVNHE